MRQKSFGLFVFFLLVVTNGNAQELESLHTHRGCIFYQASADTIVPIGEWFDGVPSWNFSIGANFLSGTVDNPRISGPSFPTGYPMEAYVYEGVEYDFEMDFNSEAGLVAFSPAGSYVFSGTGSSIGPFTETIEMAAYSPLMPKRITNFQELQAIDPGQPFLIEWESFTDLGEKLGFIEVDILSIWPWGYDEIWESPEEDGSFGLDPESTSVQVPAGVIGSDGNTVYEVVVIFTRIEDFTEETVFGSGLKAYVTDCATAAGILMAQIEGHVDLVPLQWLEDGSFGWLYGLSTDWGYSSDLGFVWVGHTPRFIFQSSLGWIVHVAGSMKDGCWFYSPASGFFYTREGFGGWYCTEDSNWHRMMIPWLSGSWLVVENNYFTEISSSRPSSL